MEDEKKDEEKEKEKEEYINSIKEDLTRDGRNKKRRRRRRWNTEGSCQPQRITESQLS